jgi:hypothetical protein
MKAQISSLLLAAELAPHDRGARAARSCGAAARARAPRGEEKVLDSPSRTLTCSSGFGIFRPPPMHGGKHPDL